jgi:hypothetical protein
VKPSNVELGGWVEEGGFGLKWGFFAGGYDAKLSGMRELYIL